MSSRPELLHQPTAATLAVSDDAKSEGTDNPLRIINESVEGPPSNEKLNSTSAAEKAAPRFSHRLDDAILVFAICIMLAWPWTFFGVVFGLGGIQASNRIASAVTNHPHTTNFLVTLIANLITMIIDILFSFAIIRFAQEWAAENNEVTVFHVSLLSAFRYRRWPWKIHELKDLLVRSRWLLAALVGACITFFAFVPPGITSLINPVPFNRTASLEGTELDFSSNAPDCLDWLNANRISNNCDWKTYKDLHYTTCLGENQMVDVLEAGRGNILSLISNNSQSLSYSQLGATSGLHFLGPIRGVLPIGPDGVPAFDTLKPSGSPFSSEETKAGLRSYNYTLGYQGLSSDVSCKYDSQSPVIFGRLPSEPLDHAYALQYNGTCEGMQGVIEDGKTYVSINSNNTLGSWVCKSNSGAGEEPSYNIYLRGRVNYASVIGNITCTASPIRPAIFPVTYQSGRGIFVSGNQTSPSSNTYPELLDRAMIGLMGVIWEAQNWESNLVVESVITFGVKSFGLLPYERNEQYLRLYEAMIKGVLEYEATYTRLIYSTLDNPPSSCIRTLNGEVSFEVIGWSMGIEHVGFLMPLTIVLLATLVIVSAAMLMGRKSGYAFDPTDTGPLLVAHVPVVEGRHHWEHKVMYNQIQAAKDALEKLEERTKEQFPSGNDVFNEFSSN